MDLRELLKRRKLTNEEKTLIALNEQLLLSFLDIVMENPDLYIETCIDIIDELDFNINNEELIEKIITVEEYIRIYNTKKEIDNGIISYNVIENQKNIDYFINKIKDNNYCTKELMLYDKTINILLDYKRYDLISKGIIPNDKINDSTFRRILNEFPFDKYYLNIEKLKNDNKLSIYNENIKILPPIALFNLLEFEPTIIYLILNKNNIETNDEKTLNYINNENLKKLIEKCLKDKTLSVILLQNKIIYTYEEINTICEIINNGYKINVEKISNTQLLNNKKFIECLLHNNYVKLSEPSVYYDKKIIIDKIRKQEIKNIETTDEEIIKELILNDNYECLKKIKKDLSKILNEKTSSILEKKLLYMDIEKLKNTPELNNISRIIKNKQKLYKDLIETNQYEKLFLIFKNENNINPFPIEYKGKIINSIKKNIYIKNNYYKNFKKEIIKDKELVDEYLTETYIEKIINEFMMLNNNEKYFDDNLFEKTKDYFSKKYNLNINNLIELKNKFGPLIIKYINNEQIQKIINLDKEKFDNFIDLFPQIQYDMNLLEAVYDSFKQEIFAKEYAEDLLIYNKIKEYVYQNDQRFIFLINKIEITLNIDLQEMKTTLISGTTEEKLVCINKLHDICKKYIAKKREEYRNTYNIIQDLGIEIEFNKAELVDQTIKILLQNSNFKTLIITKLKISLTLEEINDTIDYYLYKTNSERAKKAQKNIRLLINTCKAVINEFNNDKKEKLIEQVKKTGTFKRSRIKLDFIPSTNIFEILSKIRIDIVEQQLLRDKNKYQQLKLIIKKYKLDMLPKYIDKILSNTQYELTCKAENISAFITYFYKIIEDIEKNSITPANIFNQINYYSKTSSIYEQILGSTDARLIVANPKPYKATEKTQQQRLNDVIEYIKIMYERSEITIPSFKEVFQTKTNKKMLITVGNFTKSWNLTHGERTKTCMRNGGLGQTLFDFCLKNKNGFHISFEDLETGSYIGRATGFRNGNTVFLNTLSNSCDEDYSDLDLIEALTNISKKIIEFSKSSSCPIENVVINKNDAMKKSPGKKIILNVENVQEGLPRFYTDVSPVVEVLATSSNDAFAPVNLENSKVPSYKPTRERIQKGLVIEQINKVHAVKSILEKQDYTLLAPITDVVYGIAGQDFYVYINKENEIISEIINLDNRAHNEYKEALEEINNYLERKSKHAI